MATLPDICGATALSSGYLWDAAAITVLRRADQSSQVSRSPGADHSMKRLICLFVAVFVSPAFAAHFNCTPAGACTNNTIPCDWATAANWLTCNGDYPHNGANTFTATISTTSSYMLSTDGLTIGLATQANPALTLNGTLVFDTASSLHSGAGFLSMTLIPNNAGANSGLAVSIGAAGLLRMRASDRLFCDTTAGNLCGIDSTTGTGIWDTQGSVGQTTLDSVSALTTKDANVCDSGAAGLKQYYILVPHDYLPQMKVGRRVVFQSGQFRNRHFEIVTTSTDQNTLCVGASDPFSFCTGAGAGTGPVRPAFGICTELLDSSSTTCSAGHTCGQRLTPHITPFGKFPDATPTVNTRHWTPMLSTVKTCTNAFVPHAYCTANNAGTGWLIYPVAGDAIALVDDVWIMQTGGSAGIRLRVQTVSNTAYFPYISATNWSGLHDIQVSALSSPGLYVGRDYAYNNFHDFPNAVGSSGAGVTWTGLSDFKIQWNACHDQTSETDNSACMETARQDNASATDRNVTMSDNVAYRTTGIMIASG